MMYITTSALLIAFIMTNVLILWTLLTQQKDGCNEEGIGVGDEKCEYAGSNNHQSQEEKTVHKDDDKENETNDKNHFDELDEWDESDDHERCDSSMCKSSTDSNYHRLSPVTVYNGRTQSLLTQMVLTPPDCSVNSIASSNSVSPQEKVIQDPINNWASIEEIKPPTGTDKKTSEDRKSDIPTMNTNCSNENQTAASLGNPQASSEKHSLVPTMDDVPSQKMQQNFNTNEVAPLLQSGIVKIPNEKCKHIAQEITKQDQASNLMTTTDYKKKKHENLTISSYSTDDTDFTLSLTDIEPLYLDDIDEDTNLILPSTDIQLDKQQMNSHQKKLPMRKQGIKRFYHHDTNNYLQHHELKQTNTTHGCKGEQVINNLKKDTPQQTFQHLHINFDMKTKLQNLRKINVKESSKNLLKSPMICMESAKNKRHSLPPENEKLLQSSKHTLKLGNVMEYELGQAIQPIMQTGNSTVNRTTTSMHNTSGSRTAPKLNMILNTQDNNEDHLTDNGTTKEQSQQPFDKEQLCGVSKALTQNSIVKITKHISEFLTKKQKTGNFYSHLWVPLWRCINEQGYGRKDLCWRYCKSIGAGQLGRNFWFCPPFSNLGAKGEIGRDYFTTEEAVVGFLLPDLNFAGTFSVSRCIFDEFKMKLSRSTKEHLPFDEIHLTPNGKTKRRVKKRNLSEFIPSESIQNFKRHNSSIKRNKMMTRSKCQSNRWTL